MKLKDILGAVGSVAPAIATALGGPLAGTAVGALTSALGLKSDATEQEVAEVIAKATPEQLLMLKQADQQFAKDMKALDIDLTKAYIADTSDARHTFGTNQNVFWLGLAILCSFAAAVYAVLSGNVPSTVSEVLTGTLIGYLASNSQQVVGYFFGSSQGSADKTTAMANAVGGTGKSK
ncbi:MAG: hypothetical protein HGB02_08540 [Chlorobiaceae bacterium]|nr:hypothetical protein [Chlorobiaceae bacterium]